MTDNDSDRSLEGAAKMLHSTLEIVVGVDDDQASGGVLRWAARQSELTGLPLRVVHVWQMPTLMAGAATSGAHHYRAAAAGDARARATARVVHTLRDNTDLRWTLELIEGEPGPALVARSAGAHLLVLGTGRHTRLRRTALSSVSRYCMSHAKPPILAVPATAAVPFETWVALATSAERTAPGQRGSVPFRQAASI